MSYSNSMPNTGFTSVKVGSTSPKETKEDTEKNPSGGWASALTVCSFVMFVVMLFTASNINAPVIGSIGCGVAAMAYVRAKHEGNSKFMLYAILVIVLFVAQAVYARYTMDKSLKKMNSISQRFGGY